MRRSVYCFKALQSVFQKNDVPKNPSRWLDDDYVAEQCNTYVALAPETNDLLGFLENRDLLKASKYHFHVNRFLKDAMTAYNAVSDTLHGRDWASLQDLLPSSLFKALKDYYKKSDKDESCIPSPANSIIAKIMEANFSPSPPKFFPSQYPRPSFLLFVKDVLLSKSQLKKDWQRYLDSCAEWFKTSTLSVKVLYLIVEWPNGKVEDSVTPAVKQTHCWTFEKDVHGEWNIIEMDH
jgi:hypothetical protein